MGYNEKEWLCADGTKMFACEWTPEGHEPIKDVIGLVHGMGEHMGRYGHVADRLTAEGYAVIGFDQRGHGQTEGKRGHIPRYESLFEGIDNVIALADRIHKDLPLYLYGHSMG